MPPPSLLMSVDRGNIPRNVRDRLEMCQVLCGLRRNTTGAHRQDPIGLFRRVTPEQRAGEKPGRDRRAREGASAGRAPASGPTCRNNAMNASMARSHDVDLWIRVMPPVRLRRAVTDSGTFYRHCVSLRLDELRTCDLVISTFSRATSNASSSQESSDRPNDFGTHHRLNSSGLSPRRRRASSCP